MDMLNTGDRQFLPFDFVRQADSQCARWVDLTKLKFAGCMNRSSEERSAGGNVTPTVMPVVSENWPVRPWW